MPSSEEPVDLFNEGVLDTLNQRGMALYNVKIRPVVEPQYQGQHIAVHLDTGDYAVARTSSDARRALRARQPDGLIMTTLIGADQMDQLSYRMMGASSIRQPK